MLSLIKEKLDLKFPFINACTANRPEFFLLVVNFLKNKDKISHIHIQQGIKIFWELKKHFSRKPFKKKEKKKELKMNSDAVQFKRGIH